jgi:hypothetical protein
MVRMIVGRIAFQAIRNRGTMADLPPLYKYLNVRGAKLTLGNRTFKHSKPSDFNDLEDLTIGSFFPESDEAALAVLNSGLSVILLKHLSDSPTIANPKMRASIAVMQRVFRENPGAVKIVQDEMRKSKVFSLGQMQEKNKEFVEEINNFMQGYRILCVSTLNDSKRMWERYAQSNEGVVLRIVPNLEKDSKFALFRAVEYQDARPPLYESALSFLEDAIFGDHEKKRKAMLDKIVYAKTREWEYEKEFRLAIPIHVDGQDWNTMPYHPEEITELYLGCKMADETKNEIIRLAQAVNPEISIIETFLDEDGRISFRQ